MAPALSVQNLKKTFREANNSLEILRGIDLSVEKGEIVALVGASGAGKSTLLQIAGLLDHADSGHVHIAGQDTTSLKEEKRTEVRQNDIGFVYQFHHLLPDFSALENVALALRISGSSNKDAERRAEDILTQMGLKDRLSHIPAKLSGGEQQRVAIARALVGRPAILLADEPTGNLDESTAGQVFETMLDMVRREGVSALIATHDTSLAMKMDRQFRLHEGKLESL
ncbi:lipoprotein-releasing system ATP-binding protein LolD 2 [Kordiimonas sediminis]|uniref:Lipoprotein-releasing system ATP-binding protein LolD 2 n=1 Tax=Kordiimonas sediminis TaxID=1735581 RepID=A0A919AXS8_9PROT|nr:ABC transporter ATP-binding protein [Kordiimonas sediminis]GHF28567.1 lipoprotein-releasing system ATP-binding protein LolD 2 [Kordiimonas sediminis]